MSAKSKLEVSKARELASHLRWRASKLAPATYGERLDLNHSGSMSIRTLPPGQLETRIVALMEEGPGADGLAAR